MLGVIQLLVHSVMNTAAHSGCNTAFSAQCYKHSRTQWPFFLLWLAGCADQFINKAVSIVVLYCTLKVLRMMTEVMHYRFHVCSGSLPPSPAPSDYKTTWLNTARWRYSLANARTQAMSLTVPYNDRSQGICDCASDGVTCSKNEI